MKLNVRTDEDILNRLESIENVQGYLKALIRADIARRQQNPEQKEEKIMKYICTISSSSSHEREYDVDTKSAMKCANEFGRAEGGERVTVLTKSGKPISCVIWSAEDRKYVRVSL